MFSSNCAVKLLEICYYSRPIFQNTSKNLTISRIYNLLSKSQGSICTADKSKKLPQTFKSVNPPRPKGLLSKLPKALQESSPSSDRNPQYPLPGLNGLRCVR